ncbi:hypothetical protein FE391_44060 [Nonomuraea sp. KC401]|uniref:hypothetical protein n=1 Tax=unclassified Nonomuraea TaxID=2593643 RepID=UPI0010FEDD67|nr:MULTISPECIES: hypothetical protein [unclassified Nonomuraea]NBF00295.1 hypothetical protein [Nonomuraea sp. K271]TLF51856.1 hypothetical protein FE391_44060 [Nonomuraea sp. KC401]
MGKLRVHTFSRAGRFRHRQARPRRAGIMAAGTTFRYLDAPRAEALKIAPEAASGCGTAMKALEEAYDIEAVPALGGVIHLTVAGKSR